MFSMDLDISPLTRYESTFFMDHNHYILTGIVKTGGTVRTKRYSVVCRNVQRAIELAIKDITDLEVQSVSHQGQVQRVEI